MEVNDLPEVISRFYADTGFVELYPPQADAMARGLLDGVSMVVATPTASGKTLLAEFAMLNSIYQGGKCLYIVPLKALASEKFDRFSLFATLGIKVGISTGDYDMHDDRLGRNDIVVTTSEKADSLLRNGVEWMMALTVVVADEIHLLDSMDRGPTLEVTLTKLRKLNPRAQILALSATVANADEIAGWLNAELVISDWRPVVLHEGLYLTDSATIVFVQDAPKMVVLKKAVREDTSDPSIALALDALREGGQCLIFVNTRRNAESLAKKIATAIKPRGHPLNEEVAARIHRDTAVAERLAYCVKYGVAFHHAGLLSDHRKLIETCFRDTLIKIIVCTPTLASGLNLPARRVVVRDYKRYDANYGMTNIPVLEYKQMAGRAGRPGFDFYGEAILIAKSLGECEVLAEHYILNDSEDVISKLGTETALRMHILSIISNGFAHTRRDLEQFFDATFFGFQQNKMISLIRYAIDRVLVFLENEGMITDFAGYIKATNYGHLVSRLYIDPLTAVKIRRGLKAAQKVTDISLLHLICSTPDVKRLYMRSKDYRKVTEFVNLHLDEFLSEIPDRFRDVDYDWFLSEVKTAMLVYDWINEVSEKEITDSHNVGPGDIRNIIDTVQWVSHALSELAAYLKVPSRKHAQELTERIRFGIDRELLDLVHLKNIGRVRARRLYDAGLRSRKDLRDAPLDMIAALIGPAIAADVLEQLGAVSKSDRRKA